MTGNVDSGGDLVVKAGSVTVRTRVGAGVAYVDIPFGAPLPADVPDEDRDRLVSSGAVGRRDDQDASASTVPAAAAADPTEGGGNPADGSTGQGKRPRRRA